MEFLGNFGIDVKLLIAQIINFGLLLWLLKRFLYKPIIERIEKDETELKQTEIQKEELEQQKNAFIEQKKKEIVTAKNRAQEIIKEVEYVSTEIKKETYEKAKKEAEMMITQSKNQLESLKPEIEKEIFKKIQEEIRGSFEKSFRSIFSLSLQKEFQNVFWTDFVKQIKELTLQKLKDPNLVEVFEKLNVATRKNIIEKELEEIFAQKIGPTVLEYAHPLTIEQEEKLEKILSEKVGIKLNIIKKQNKSIINGFRFEIAGIIIESNLLNIINDASNLKK